MGAHSSGPTTASTGEAPASQKHARPVQVDRTVVSPDEAVGIEELYARAVQLAADGRNREAAAAFDRVVSLDPNGRFAARSSFGAGESFDAAGEFEQAAGRYQQLARRFPKHPLARAGLIRAVRLFAHLERWPETRDVADALLTRFQDLSLVERIVGHSGRALALVSLEDPPSARYDIEMARGLVERARLDQAGRLPTDLALLYYALGELRRYNGERIVFEPTPANFATVLEQRCQLLLDAQSAYSDAMRAYDAHWSAMAGYRVGQLYQRLHEDLMKVQPPKAADTPARRQLFEGAMRLRYSVLLEKGLAMMEHTVQMAERTGEQSSWVHRARQAHSELEAAIKHEQAAIDALPYSRAELQRALDDLKRRAEAQAAGSKPGA